MIRLAFATTCLVGVSLLGARAEDVRAIAALIVNGAPQADTTIVWRDGVVWVPAAALHDAGVKDVKAIEARAIDIERVPHLAPANLGERVRIEWDENDVALKLTLPPELLPPQTIDIPTARPAGMIRPRPISAFLNYAASIDGGRTGLTLETGISLRGKLLRSSVARDLFGRWRRGPTAFVVDDERRLMRWEIGDGVLSGGSLGGAAQVLGVTVSREFGIDPYFVRYTPLTLTGAATTASSAEVYVNGQLVARESIAPGAFTLRGLLAPVGAGRAEVVLRDAFGREQRLSSSFYQPVTLLRPGLHQFRYGVGARRDDEAALLRSIAGAEAYRGFAAVGDHRIGVKDWLTMGGRVEVTDETVGISPEVALRAPIGELGLTMAGSRDDRAGTGGAAALGWSWRGRIASVGATMRGATEEYRSVGVSRLLPAIRREMQAYGGMSLPRGISVVMQHAAALDWAGDRTQRSVLSASMPLTGRATFNASVGRSRFSLRSGTDEGSALGERSGFDDGSSLSGRSRLGGGRPSLEAFVGIGFRLGPRSSIDTAYSRTAGRDRSTVTYQRSLPIGPGVGARVQVDPLSRGANTDAVVQVQGAAGRVELRHATIGRAVTHGASEWQSATSVSVMGGIVALEGRLHATRPVDGRCVWRGESVGRAGRARVFESSVRGEDERARRSRGAEPGELLRQSSVDRSVRRAARSRHRHRRAHRRSGAAWRRGRAFRGAAIASGDGARRGDRAWTHDRAGIRRCGRRDRGTTVVIADRCERRVLHRRSRRGLAADDRAVRRRALCVRVRGARSAARGG